MRACVRVCVCVCVCACVHVIRRCNSFRTTDSYIATIHGIVAIIVIVNIMLKKKIVDIVIFTSWRSHNTWQQTDQTCDRFAVHMNKHTHPQQIMHPSHQLHIMCGSVATLQNGLLNKLTLKVFRGIVYSLYCINTVPLTDATTEYCFFDDTYSILPCCWSMHLGLLHFQFCMPFVFLCASLDTCCSWRKSQWWRIQLLIMNRCNDRPYTISLKNPKEIEHNHNHYNRQCRLATQHTERGCFKQLAFEKFISLTARKPFSEPKLHWCHMKSADLRKTECWVPLALKRCTKRKKSHRAASSERQQRKKNSASSERQQKKKKSASSKRQQRKKNSASSERQRKKKKKKKKRSAHRVLPGSDRNGADWTPWNKKTQAAILCRSYTVLLNVPFFFTPGPHPAWALGGPRTWSQQPNHRRWPPWPSRRQKAPHHTTPTFSEAAQHSCLFISVENAFRVHKALAQGLFAQFAATAPISVLQMPTRLPEDHPRRTQTRLD